jgi:hypothetical protein
MEDAVVAEVALPAAQIASVRQIEDHGERARSERRQLDGPIPPESRSTEDRAAERRSQCNTSNPVPTVPTELLA